MKGKHGQNKHEGEASVWERLEFKFLLVEGYS